MSQSSQQVILSACGETLAFELSEITFFATGIRDAFAAKNNKTLRETLAHKRYSSLAGTVQEKYAQFFEVPLGTFLATLKAKADPFYLKFLNSYGDGEFCSFRMSNLGHRTKKGLYLYRYGLEVTYLGRSYDPFAKRVDQGYGKIHPKNCFIDGQSTNCHLNALIQANRLSVTFHVCPLTDDALIESAERELIKKMKPPWNIALAR
jgi:hypothetical protein